MLAGGFATRQHPKIFFFPRPKGGIQGVGVLHFRLCESRDLQGSVFLKLGLGLRAGGKAACTQPKTPNGRPWAASQGLKLQKTF